MEVEGVCSDERRRKKDPSPKLRPPVCGVLGGWQEFAASIILEIGAF